MSPMVIYALCFVGGIYFAKTYMTSSGPSMLERFEAWLVNVGSKVVVAAQQHQQPPKPPAATGAA